MEAKHPEEGALVCAETEHRVGVLAHVELGYVEVQMGVRRRKS